jgi:hypothetical protein
MSKNERVISDPEAAGWEFDPATGYWMWKGEEGTGGGLWEQSGDDIYYSDGNVGIGAFPPPQHTLYVSGDDATVAAFDHTGAGSYIKMTGSDGSAFVGQEAGGMVLQTQGVTRLNIGADGDTTFSGSVNLAGGGLKYRTASNITLDSDAIAGYLAIGGAEHYSWNATDFRPQTDAQYDLGASNATWKDGFFSGGVYVKGSPLTRTVDLIKTLIALRDATMDETQDIREALRSAIDELVDGLEHEIATMPVPEPEASTMPAPEDS